MQQPHGAGKETLRASFRVRRRELLAGCGAGLLQHLEVLLAQAGSWPQDGGAPVLATRRGRLGLYWPLAGEPDLRPLLTTSPTWCRHLALPAIAAGRLDYRPWQPGEALAADACGIPAPLERAGRLEPEALALLLVPALAIDRQGVRLGYGGGWYDRLRGQECWRRVPALAVLPSGCLCDQLPRDPWDVPLDGWLTERGLHWLGKTEPAAPHLDGHDKP
ncbi:MULTISPECIES: 5-formyltetrahydrofolate cyclo-ligase [unclassified Cyanobium]|uniref:5-formyltetrahydrofolate cyclo-ligase n=1 Tax=unclassified Cyanobium TaxID=2627006 RepID=UPI0016472637|nr:MULTISPECIES: 5-formyltetrahydrofolate cyclo-ligase [unclassified Cyanobium]MBE9152746.1 5-formyltetrahydrofolate cyclo-ligase [Cyanobium sp. LEGE 06113]MBE9153049.1 5-formyltetrahydrofolate cyclo-ligase [Cyanobium sp. LEGE 06113]QNI71293.1 5-formyltetrahydrofolate cyclo-ligase [Cyanobium sp. NS01]